MAGSSGKLHRSMRHAVSELKEPYTKARFMPKDVLRSMLSKETLSDSLKELKIFSTELLEFIANDALCIFAILAVCDKICEIEKIFNAASKVTDHLLPVRLEESEEPPAFSLVPISGDTCTSLEDGEKCVICSSGSDWNINDCESFCFNQWFFLAVEFTDSKFEYTIHQEQPFPFLPPQLGRPENGGYFSTVKKEVIHHEYVHGERNLGALQSMEGQDFCVAVKVVKEPNHESGGVDRYDLELNVLKTVRELDHPHLITAIAAYTRGDEKAFIFPWAEGENLLKLFDHYSDDSDRCPEKITWIIGQILGILQGLSTLHDRNCRHGDLKPENILHFPDRGVQYESRGRLTGKLVVADVGLTKFHQDPTSHRRTPTMTWTGTQKYEPPEVEMERGANGVPRTRLYDVWSMGCVLLETLIWLIHGLNERNRFMRHMDKFWQQEGNALVVHVRVRSWIRNLEQNERCSTHTALGAILKLCRDKMLVVNTENRAAMRICMEEMDRIDQEIKTQGLSYVYNQAVWNVTMSGSGPPDVFQTSDGRLTTTLLGDNNSQQRRLSVNESLTDVDAPVRIVVKDFGGRDGQNSEYVSA